MLIPQEIINTSKEKMGEEAAIFIKEKLDIQNWDEKNLKGSCPLQPNTDNTPSFIWNPKENCFHCFSCGANFGILDYYMQFENLSFLDACSKLFEQTNTVFRFGEKGVKTKKEYKYPKCDISEDRSKVDSYCESRKISKKTLDYCNVQQSNDGLLIWNFYDENDVLSTVKCRQPKKINKSEPKEWYLPNYDNTPILYNMNKIDISQKKIVITEGQFDTLAIIESGFKNCVSVPGGAENMKWIETCFDWLNQFDKIIFFGDADEPGKKMVKEASARLGHWRCSYVDLPSEIEIGDKKLKLKDANEILFYCGPDAVISYIDSAQDFPVQDVIDLCDADDFDIETAPGLYSGLKSLDNIVYKFLFGNLIILTGKKGSGKSTFLNQTFVCNALNQGLDAFIFSGELGTSILKNWMECTMIGREHIEMKNGFVRKFDPESRKLAREWYKGRIWTYDGLNNDSETVIDRAISVTRKFGVKIWILDNLSVLDIGATDNGNQWQKEKDFIVRLVGLARTYGILIVLASHPRKMGGLEIDRRVSGDDIAGSNSIGNLAQYILSVHRFGKREKAGEKDNKGNFKRGKEPIPFDVVIDVLKNRPTGKMGEVNVFFDFIGYRFYETVLELYHRYKWDKNTTPIPSKDPNHHEGDAPEGFGED